METLPSINPFVIAEIRAWMARRHHNQGTLALAIGRSPDWVSRRIGSRAKQPLDVDDLALFGRVLDVDPSTLMSAACSEYGRQAAS